MSAFKIDIRQVSNINVIDLKGYLDAHTAPDLETTLQRLLDEKKFLIVVNCRELTYISSAGLGVFMAFIEDVRKSNGDIKLTNMSPKVFNVFDLLGFPLLYDIMKNEEEAIGKFLSTKK